MGRGFSFVRNKAWGMSRKRVMSPVVGCGSVAAEGRGVSFFGNKDLGMLPKSHITGAGL